MTCEFPPALDPIELMAFVDGEPPQMVAEHIENCAFCRAEAQRLARTQSRLIARLYRANCPPSLDLSEFHLGLLPGRQADSIAAHLSDCPHCQGEIAELRAFLNQADPVPQPGALERLGQATSALIAQLLPGPVLSPAFAGLRGAAHPPMIYEAGDLHITLDIQATPARPNYLSILGLVVGLRAPETCSAHLWQDHRLLETVALDEFGNLEFDALKPGTYDLILSGAPTEIHIQGLIVKPD